MYFKRTWNKSAYDNFEYLFMLILTLHELSQLQMFVGKLERLHVSRDSDLRLSYSRHSDVYRESQNLRTQDARMWYATVIWYKVKGTNPYGGRSSGASGA